jgi:N-acetylglucosaminyldiphosphoundecaprenol N-acetyl-beta-D-mannosaminyltransferase
MTTRLNLLGIQVNLITLQTAIAEMESSIVIEQPSYVCTCPVYTLMQGHERSEVRAALNSADWVTPDGMPVVWALRWLGASQVGRVYGPDLMLALSEISAQKGYGQYYLGGAPGVAEQLGLKMQQRFPGLKVAGTYCPPFRELTLDEEQMMISHLNASEADIVWVGLGSPKQDLWMAKYRASLKPALLVGVGAAFDFFTGRQPQAPRWMQHSGLEWLFRLASEPRRLWRRYLINNPKFLFQLALQLAGLRHYK